MTEQRDAKAKDTQLGVRIPNDLRAALEAEAAATGRTMSQVAIAWMQKARSVAGAQSALQDLSPVGEVLRKLHEYAALVGEHIPDPALARTATIRGWTLLIQTLGASGVSPTELALTEKKHAAANVVERLVTGLADLSIRNPDHPGLVPFVETPSAEGGIAALIRGSDPLGRLPTVELLRRFQSDPADLAPLDRALDRLAPVVDGETLSDEPELEKTLAALFGAGVAIREVELAQLAAQREAAEKGQALLMTAFFSGPGLPISQQSQTA